MNIQIQENNNIRCALVNDSEKIIRDVSSALDLLMTVSSEAGTKNIILDKQLVTEEFFVLSSGLAGEILQKYTNYGGRIAIFGDYSGYTSKPLRDFIYESNQGTQVFFPATQEEALALLTR